MRYFRSMLACLLLANSAVYAQQIAIVDTAWDTTNYVDALRANGVQVIGRYYARCEHMDGFVPEKRFAFRAAEVGAIKRAGMAILSIYQFHSSSKFKFDGMRMKNGALQPLFDANCNPAAQGRSAKAEAKLDAKAAIEQARMVGQPRGSAIYFGVDFNFSKSDTDTRKKMILYFKEMRKHLNKAGLQMGIYGDGDALSVLQQAGLADYSWIMASRSFRGSSALHRAGRWNLFQAQVDRLWFKNLPIDLNIQNPAQGSYIGFWNANGPFEVPARQSANIFAARRFVCNGDARLRPRANSTQDALVSGKFKNADTRKPVPQIIGYAQALRVGQQRKKLIQVDVNDDGTFDGWTWAGNLSANFNGKPDYVSRNKDLRCR